MKTYFFPFILIGGALAIASAVAVKELGCESVGTNPQKYECSLDKNAE